MPYATSALPPLVLWFTASAALTGCGGDRAAAPASPTAAAAAAPAVFELGELTVFEGTEAMIKVHADGSSELGSHAFQPSASGEPASSDATQIRWEPGPTLRPDGTFTFSGGNGAPKPDAAPHAEGANTPGKRRVVLALFGMLLGGDGHVETVPGAGPSTPPR